MRERLLASAVVLLHSVSIAWAQGEAPDYGPPKGALVIAGGGSLAGTGIIEKFIQLAGGVDKKFIVVPTARGNWNEDGSVRRYEAAQILAPWLKLGIKKIKLLHTADPKVADSEEFVKDLMDADAVWFDGGRQWNIVDSYANTRTLAEFRKVLDRGGVIGGSSAGATIQGEYLVRGDTSGPNVMMTAEANHQQGFKFLRRSAIDQHVDTRNRWDDLIPVIRRFPSLLGIGLAENTAIVVTGDKFEVIGRGMVAVHDNTHAPLAGEKPYSLLSSGAVYDMKTRAADRR